MYISKPVYKGEQKFEVYIITPYIYSKKLSNKYVMCSIPHEEILPQNVLTMSFSDMLLCHRFLVALSSLIYVKISVHFIVKQYLPKV